MRITVYMTAYGRQGDVRYVDVPDEEIFASEDPVTGTNVLDLVYHYGQNEEQSQPYPSLSAGDVVALPGGQLVMCAAIGWRAISREQFAAYEQESYPQSRPVSDDEVAEG